MEKVRASARLAAVLLCLAASAATLGCSRGNTQADEAAQQGILLVGNKIEPPTLDPQISTSGEVFNVDFALFEGLTSPDPHSLEPVPAVAESWELSPDGLRYTFHLRPDACWSDGSALGSADFMFSWERLLRPELASANANLLFAVRGARDFNEGRAPDFGSVGISAPDAHTLCVELTAPTPWFLSILMHPSAAAMPRKSIESAGKPFDRSSGWSRAPDMLSNGPFAIVRWDPNSVIEVKKNPRYWDAGNVRLNGIRFLPIESINTEAMAYQGGQLHVTQTVPINRVARLRDNADPALRVDHYLGVYYYVFNTRHPPLDNPDVRLALSLAIDRSSIVVNLLGGAQEPAVSFTPAGIRGYEPPRLCRTDVLKARALMEKAGYPGGKGFPKLELLFNTSENHRVIAEAVQAMWKENLGIEVELRNEDFNSYIGTRNSGNFDIVRASWVADYPAAATFLDILRSGAGNNLSRWQNADYDTFMDAAASAEDEATRNGFYAQAESLLLESAPVMPIYQYNTVRMISPTVHGWYPTPMDWHPYKYLWLQGPSRP
ncbi:MAG: peptide ABC transporter substrate-binding protein [Opitutales bacterium]